MRKFSATPSATIPTCRFCSTRFAGHRHLPHPNTNLRLITLLRYTLEESLMSDNTASQRRGVPVDTKSRETDPDLPTLLDPDTCTNKGLCPVTHIRGQDDDPLESHSLYYEIHGSGPECVVLIMGYVQISWERSSFSSWATY